MRVLLAPDKFKGSLSAEQVADHLQAGMKRTAADASFDRCPIADGGEGTVDAVVTTGFRRLTAAVEGPTGEPVHGDFAELDGVAVVEPAQAGFAKVYSLLDIEHDVGQCHARGGEILGTIGARIGSAWCRPARPDRVGVTMWSRYCGPEI